jgi:alpha-tubulin suppressor-like RCC1 family protein
MSIEPAVDVRRSVPAFVWGYNNTGGLGLGHTAKAYHPLPTLLPESTIAVMGGAEFTVALTEAGVLYGWGGNQFGELGLGSRRRQRAPVAIPLEQRVTSIAAGADHMLAMTDGGAVYAWGRNHHGQVGDGSGDDRLTPRCVVPRGVVSLAAGNAVSAAVTGDGELLTWGRNTVGQLGQGDSSSPDVAAPARARLPEGARAIVVAAGHRHLVVVDGSGGLLGYGRDPEGRPLSGALELAPAWGRVTSVSAGDDFTLALTDEGVLLAWGSNRSGQLGLGDRRNRHEPTPVSLPDASDHVTGMWAGARGAVALTGTGHVYTWGETSFGQSGRGQAAPPADAPEHVTLLDGASISGVSGGSFHVVLTTHRGPAARLRLTPARSEVDPDQAVTYQVHALDAFGNDLGAASEVPGVDPVAVGIADGRVDGDTARSSRPGRHQVTARAGRLIGTAILTVRQEGR